MSEFRLHRGIALLAGLLGASLVTVTGAVEMVPIPPPSVPAPPVDSEQGMVEAQAPAIDDQPYVPPPEPPAPPVPPPGYSPPRPAPSPAPAASVPAAADKPVPAGQMLFNFQDADIQAVVKTVAQLTGRNFLLDPRVKGRITIISDKPVSKAAIYEIFVSALKAQGFSAVEGPGGIVKLIPEAEAKQGAEVSGPSPRKSDRWMTQVVEVQYASAPQLIPLLRPLMSPSAMLSVYAPGNILVMTDTATSIRSVLRVIEKIDRQGAIEVTIIPLQHASVVDVAQLLGRFTEGAQIPGVPGQPQAAVPGMTADARLLVVPDLRTNSLLVRSDNPGRIAELKSLIEKLDVPAKPGGNTHVIYLRNAEAVKLAEVLRGLLAGETRAAGPAAAAVPGMPAGAAAAGRGAEASTIQADESSNALIISANDAVYNNLRAVIEKLDQRRAQVYVEALVVETTQDRATEFGIQWAAAGARVREGSAGVAAVQNFPSGPGIIDTVVSQGLALAGPPSVGGLTLGFVGKEITIRLPDSACATPPCETTTRGVGGLVRALEGDTRANILSTPNLVMLDNAEGKIVVGQNVPFLTGSFAQATGTNGAAVNPFQTIERQDVGLTLKIKPQISEGGVVKLEIFQEVSSVAQSAQAAADLITNKRSIETTVLIDDGNIMVLGGLIEDRKSGGEQKVPLLGDIPLLGALFKYRNTSNQKTNLMVFLRPVILRSATDSYAITSDRYDVIMVPEAHRYDHRVEIKERFRPVKPQPKEEPVEPAEDESGEPAHEGRLGPPPVGADDDGTGETAVP
jgi:general secretion pathway protein D